MIRCYQIKQHQSSALDLQTSATTYVAREVAHPSLDDLATVAELIEIGRPIPSELEGALLRGTSIGGTRPKALIKDGDRALIA
jgi:serine/threonine-protein kinase HipA